MIVKASNFNLSKQQPENSFCFQYDHNPFGLPLSFPFLVLLSFQQNQQRGSKMTKMQPSKTFAALRDFGLEFSERFKISPWIERHNSWWCWGLPIYKFKKQCASPTACLQQIVNSNKWKLFSCSSLFQQKQQTSSMNKKSFFKCSCEQLKLEKEPKLQNWSSGQKNDQCSKTKWWFWETSLMIACMKFSWVIWLDWEFMKP